MVEPSVTHAQLLVDEYSACFRFYRDQLGFEPTFGDVDSGCADFETGDVTLALFDGQEMDDGVDDPTPSGTGRDAVCGVLRVTDVDAIASTLRDQGVELAAAPSDRPEWGVRTVHARDPDGTLIEFNEPLET